MNHFLAQCDTPEYQMQWEQYSVYFLSCFYMEASQTRNPRKCIAVFAYLYCLGFYFSALSAAEKKHPPTIPELFKAFNAAGLEIERTAVWSAISSVRLLKLLM